MQQERRQEKQVDSHNKRKTARANYSSDSKDTEESEVESSEVDSDDTEDESDDDDVDVENEVEIKDESDQGKFPIPNKTSAFYLTCTGISGAMLSEIPVFLLYF